MVKFKTQILNKFWEKKAIDEVLLKNLVILIYTIEKKIVFLNKRSYNHLIEVLL